MYGDDDLLPVSALQHLVYCERQAALIHVERIWVDNPLTLEGHHLHRRVDDQAPRREVRGDVVLLRGLPLRSLQLGLVGRSDVVELHRREGRPPPFLRAQPPEAVPITGLSGIWAVLPVEYKRGKPKTDRCDEVQICAQAVCLEEMLAVRIPHGALFYGRRQRRHDVVFDAHLRTETEQAVERFRHLMTSGRTPKAQRTAKCERCSLQDVCLPQAMRSDDSVERYLRSCLSPHSSKNGEEDTR